MGHNPGWVKLAEESNVSGSRERSGLSRVSNQELLDFTFNEKDRLQKVVGAENPDVEHLQENADELARRITKRG